MFLAAVVFVLAAVFGLLFTRLGRSAAGRVGMLDAPDGRLKTHPRPIPATGGLALLAAVPAALATAACLVPGVAEAFAGRADRLWAVAVAAVLLAAVGILDDLRTLRARHKLLGQLLAAAVLIGGGDYLIREVCAFGLAVPLGPFAVPVTLVGFVFAVNAFNLLDGMDGMLAVVGGTALLGLAATAAVNGSAAAVLVSAATVGGLVGFLRYNLPPATVYLGNSGSMIVGMTVAVLAVDAAPAGTGFAVVPPLALLVLPVLDTTAAVARRKLTGRPLARGDRGHLHHVLRRHGFGVPRVLLLVGGCGAAAAAGAVLSAYWKNDGIAVGAAAAVAALLVASGLFGATEVRLLGTRLKALVRPLAGLARRDAAAFGAAVSARGPVP